MSLDFSLIALRPTEVFSANITHNITSMWHEAGIYDALYNSEGKRAVEVLATLRAGLIQMESDPEKYSAMDSPNGWGKYENALPWLQQLIRAIERNPDARIEVSK